MVANSESIYSQIISRNGGNADCFGKLLDELRLIETAAAGGTLRGCGLTCGVCVSMAKTRIIEAVRADGHPDWAEDLRLLRDFSWRHLPLNQLKEWLGK